MITKLSKLRSLENLSIREGFFFSLMIGFGETYFAPFTLYLGLGEIVSGLITTVPLLTGAILQLTSLWFVERLQSFKRWAILCTFFQALSFLPFLYWGYMGKASVILFFSAVALYWGAGMATGPSWNAWMGVMIPAKRRVAFWGRRLHLTQMGALIGFLVGGALLHFAHIPGIGFLLIFLIAFTCRSISVFLLNQHPEPSNPPEEILPESFSAPLKFLAGPTEGKFVRYVLFMLLSVHIASPYFTPFMLAQLNLGYPAFVMLTAISLITKVLTMPYLSRRIRKNGVKEALWFSGIGIMILPALWLISHNLVYLAVVQALSGFFWANLDLAFPLLILETAEPRDRLGVLTLFNFGRSIVIVIGSLVGAVLLEKYGTSYFAYQVTFIVSTVLRLTSLFIIWKVPLPKINLEIISPPIAIRPSLGSIGNFVIEEIKKRSQKDKIVADKKSGSSKAAS